MLLQRMIRAARLEPALYYEVKRDSQANPQAFLVVLIVIACMVLGVTRHPLFFVFGALRLALCMIGGWLCWATVATFVGARFRVRADFDDLMRPLGFAYAPGVLYLFALTPGIGRPLTLVVWAWSMIARVVAVREGAQCTTMDAVLTSVVTTMVMAVFSAITGITLDSSFYLLRQVVGP